MARPGGTLDMWMGGEVVLQGLSRITGWTGSSVNRKTSSIVPEHRSRCCVPQNTDQLRKTSIPSQALLVDVTWQMLLQRAQCDTKPNPPQHDRLFRPVAALRTPPRSESM